MVLFNPSQQSSQTWESSVNAARSSAPRIFMDLSAHNGTESSKARILGVSPGFNGDFWFGKNSSSRLTCEADYVRYRSRISKSQGRMGVVFIQELDRDTSLEKDSEKL